MAAKLILSMDGVVLHEYLLNKERMTIGRKPHNDVVIDNLAVSGEHAAVVTILNDSFLEDLDSTNGVVVNGVSIKKHFLQPNDVIEISKFKLKYINDTQGQQVSAEDFERTMVLRAAANKPQSGLSSSNSPDLANLTNRRTSLNSGNEKPHDATSKHLTPSTQSVSAMPNRPAQSSAATLSTAALQILSGASAGRELELVKSLTTLGKPGVQVAVLTRRPQGYYITHVEGAKFPLLNGKLLNEQPHQLNNHDIIELAGVKMEFYLRD